MLYMCENINLGLNTNVYHNLELGKRTNVREQKNVHMLPAQFALSIQVIFLVKNLKYISEGKKKTEN